MRRTVLEQLPLVIPPHAHEHVAEVAAMGAILDASGIDYRVIQTSDPLQNVLGEWLAERMAIQATRR